MDNRRRFSSSSRFHNKNNNRGVPQRSPEKHNLSLSLLSWGSSTPTQGLLLHLSAAGRGITRTLAPPRLIDPPLPSLPPLPPPGRDAVAAVRLSTSRRDQTLLPRKLR